MSHALESTAREAIAAILQETGESYTAVGHAIGLSVALVGRRMRGITPWTLTDLGRLCEHWDVPPSALLGSPTQARQALKDVTREDHMSAA